MSSLFRSILEGGGELMKASQLSASRFVRWMQEPIRPINMATHQSAGVARAVAPPPTIMHGHEPFASESPRAVGADESGGPQQNRESRSTLLPEKFRLYWDRASLANISHVTRRHSCPYCHGHQFRRSRPRSVEWVLCLVRVIPYRCYCCNHRFFGLLIDSNPFAERFSHLS